MDIESKRYSSNCPEGPTSNLLCALFQLYLFLTDVLFLQVTVLFQELKTSGHLNILHLLKKYHVLGMHAFIRLDCRLSARKKFCQQTSARNWFVFIQTECGPGKGLGRACGGRAGRPEQ